MKPPIGIMPKHIWQENRFMEVCSAITRYYNASLPIPIEWVEEYNELVVIRLSRHKNNDLESGTKNFSND
jgi:hypothetical protein